MEGVKKVKTSIDSVFKEVDEGFVEIGFPSVLSKISFSKPNHEQWSFPDDFPVAQESFDHHPLSKIWGFNCCFERAQQLLRSEQGSFLQKLNVFPLGENPMQDEESFYFWLVVDCKKGSSTFGSVFFLDFNDLVGEPEVFFLATSITAYVESLKDLLSAHKDKKYWEELMESSFFGMGSWKDVAEQSFPTYVVVEASGNGVTQTRAAMTKASKKKREPKFVPDSNKMEAPGKIFFCLVVYTKLNHIFQENGKCLFVYCAIIELF